MKERKVPLVFNSTMFIFSKPRDANPHDLIITRFRSSLTWVYTFLGLPHSAPDPRTYVETLITRTSQRKTFLFIYDNSCMIAVCLLGFLVLFEEPSSVGWSSGAGLASPVSLLLFVLFCLFFTVKQ